uniref:Uncharacterized protein n=1 Tax=Rhizophora mucronata TaxID=61149 RepID=A0A2P2PTE3_RHIMU
MWLYAAMTGVPLSSNCTIDFFRIQTQKIWKVTKLVESKIAK